MNEWGHTWLDQQNGCIFVDKNTFWGLSYVQTEIWGFVMIKDYNYLIRGDKEYKSRLICCMSCNTSIFLIDFHFHLEPVYHALCGILTHTTHAFLYSALAALIFTWMVFGIQSSNDWDFYKPQGILIFSANQYWSLTFLDKTWRGCTNSIIKHGIQLPVRPLTFTCKVTF